MSLKRKIAAWACAVLMALAYPINLDGQGSLSPLLGVTFSAHVATDPFNTLPSALQNVAENFGSCCTQFTTYTESTIGAISVASNVMTITNTGVENIEVTESSSSYTLPLIFTSIEITQNGTDTSGYDNFGVGIFKDNNNFLNANIDRIGHFMRAQIKIAGTNTFLGTASGFTVPTAPWYLGMGLIQDKVTFWDCTSSCTANGSGWNQVNFPASTQVIDVSSKYDFSTSGNLSGWKAGFTVANGSSHGSVWKVANFNAGTFGCIGIRDMTLVTNEDGSPYVDGSGLVRFTATAASPGGFGYTGVFTWDPVNSILTEVGAIEVVRSGHIYNDEAAHIIYYPGGERKFLIATWGTQHGDINFSGSIQVQYEDLTSGPDILSGNNAVSSMTALTLPGQTGCTGTGCGTYDSMMFYDSANSRWEMAYTITLNTAFTSSPFFAAAAYASSPTGTWTLISSDTSNTGYEGTKVIKTGVTYYIAAGGQAGCNTCTSRVYDQSLSYLGALNATFSGSTATQPHPMVYIYGTKYYLDTFDATVHQPPAGKPASFQWGDWWQETATCCSTARQVQSKVY